MWLCLDANQAPPLSRCSTLAKLFNFSYASGSLSVKVESTAWNWYEDYKNALIGASTRQAVLLS